MLSADIFCSNCGSQNQKEAKFCFKCGNQLTQGKESPTTNPSNSTNSEINNATGFLSTNTILKQRYRVLHSVGRGGMGAVYMGEDMQLGNRLVAIKEMSQGSLDPQEVQTAIESFKREALLLAGLQHPNLPSIYDHFEQNQRWYLVMSFIQGETLQDYMKYVPNGKIPPEEVLKIGTELCSVLHYLHTYQPPIVFRDLKPSNIMRDKNGHIYLIDFGIARHFKPGQEKDTASYATVGYASPEQYGRAQTTPRSDIYSLGATLYYFLSGYAPSQSPFRLPQLQSLVPTLPLRLTKLITNMLDLEADRRPPDMTAVKQELQAITGSLNTKDDVKKPAVKPFSLKKLGTGVLIFLGIVASLTGLGLLLFSGTGPFWYAYFGDNGSYSSGSYSYSTYYSVSPILLIGSIVLLVGFLTLYVPWSRNLTSVAVKPITRRRKIIARVGVFLGCILLVWGIWGWVRVSPYDYAANAYNDSSNNPYANLVRYFNSPYTYTYTTLGFGLLALTGIFIILATTTKSFGLSHTKSKKEMAQKIITILATFVLLFGTTFLLPETLVVAIVCFLVGGGVLIVTQWRQ